MPEIDPTTWSLLLPWWAAASAAFVVVILLFFAFARVGLREPLGALAQFAAVLGLVLAWGFLDRLTLRDRADERRAIETRLAELTARAIAPGSTLACLDAMAGDIVEENCEKALFASPEQVAAAVAYVGARLTLLADVTDFSNRGDVGEGQALAGLRRAAEMDRFGLVAHVLATRDGCTADRCDTLELLREPNHVIANLKDRAFDKRVVRYSANWDRKGGPVLAGAPASTETASAAPATSTGVNINFPSATSIPPVSIMNNEPGMTGQNGMEPPAKPETPPARRAATKGSRAADANAPVPIAPQRPAAAPPRAQ